MPFAPAVPVLLLAALLLPARVALAETRLVTTPAELAQAITDLQAAPPDPNDPDVIELPPGQVFTFDAPAAGAAPNSALPFVTGTLTIRTQGDPATAAPAVIERGTNAATAFRLFYFGSSATATLQNVVVRNGFVGGDLPGGCVLVEGTAATPFVVLQRVQVANCIASRGGGIAVDEEVPSDGSSAELQLEDSTVSGNQAVAGGGIAVRGDSLVGLLRTTVTGNTARGSRLSGAAGGGIATPRVLDVEGLAEVLLQDSTVSGNAVIGAMGEPAAGGGIGDETGSTYTIARCTLSGNSVEGSGQAVVGGGISARDFGGVDMQNVTIAENVVTQTDAGLAIGGGLSDSLGILLGDLAPVWDLQSVTITRNRAVVSPLSEIPTAQARGGGIGLGIEDGSGSSLSFGNSIIAGNEAVVPSTDFMAIGPDCSWLSPDDVESFGHNLVGVGLNACTPFATDATDITGEDPLLGPLADNGGPTSTIGPLSGSSPIVDTGDPACTVPLTLPLTDDDPETDQRGILRPQGASCDIGAFELTTTTTTTTLVGQTTTTTTPGGGSTTTLPGGGGTTTTTLPDACPGGLTIASVGCRLAELADELAAAGDLGKLARPLSKALNAARAKTSQASAVVGQKPPKASKALKQAAKKLSAFTRKLNSKAGRKLDEPTRTRLLGPAQQLVTDLKQLATNPA